MTGPIAQLCRLITEKLRDEPEVALEELVAHVEGAVAANAELPSALQAYQRMQQDNRDRAKGFQFLAEDGSTVFIEGTPYHLSDLARFKVVLEAVLKRVQSIEAETVNFESYLHSLVTTYEQWWKLYALTDAVGQIREQEQEQALPSPFDFGLMVQTVSKEREHASSEADPIQEKREKPERLPVLEGICKYADDHVLLVGHPGSGKSTALIRLLLEMATQALEQGSGKIPILVELRYWQNSVIERIQAFLYKHDPNLSLNDSTLTSLLRQGRFLLLMDGLNEFPSKTARTQLASFRQDYSKVPMIFTTRDLGLAGDLGIEKKLEMQPLTEGQMKEFIRAYMPDQTEAMLRQLNDRLREFGQTPLLLWMLCEVFQQSPDHQMPSNLAGIFQAFTKMYEDSSLRKHEVALLKGDVKPLSDRRLWKPALKALAAVMMQGATPVDFRVAIHRDEAEQELSRIFPNEKFPVRDILDDLLKYHLLQNRSADQIEFRHQLIQEYYAAEYLLRLLPDLSDEQLKRAYLNLLKWTEPIALMLALVDEEEQALRVIRLGILVDGILAGKLLGSAHPLFLAKTTNLVIQLLVCRPLKIVILYLAYIKSRNTNLLLEVINLLEIELEDYSYRNGIFLIECLKGIFKESDLGKKHSVPIITRALYHQDHRIRSEAFDFLERYDLQLPLDLILEKERRKKARISFRFSGVYSSNRTIRKVSVNNLCEDLGHTELILKFIEIIGNPESNFKKEIYRLLDKVLDIPCLVELFWNFGSKHFYVYEEICLALEESPSKEYILSEINKTLEEQRIIRENVNTHEALFLFFGLLRRYIVSQLLESSKSRNLDIRRDSVFGLFLLKEEVEQVFWVEALEDDDPFIFRCAIYSLGLIDRQNLISEIWSEIKSKNLKRIDPKNNFPLIFKDGKSLPDRIRAVNLDDLSLDSQILNKFNNALERFANKEIEGMLIDIARFDYYPFHDKASEVAGIISSERFILKLIEIIEGGTYDSHEYLSIISALQKFVDVASLGTFRSCEENHKIISRVIELFNSSEPRLRLCLDRILGLMSTDYLLPTLWPICLTSANLHPVIKIQKRFGYYNYEIFHNIPVEGKTISLYFSYSPADEALQTQLANHLTLLERRGVITNWSQRQILPGEEPAQVINQQLNTADIILLLISANSLADDTCYNLEIQRAIERHQVGEARVINILLRPVDWVGSPFSQLEVLPKNHQPVTTWANQDDAFREIAEGIRAVSMELRRE